MTVRPPAATETVDSTALIYDWNELDRRGPVLRRPPVFVDETIRDGIQSPSVKDPSIEEKMELVRLMDRLGIHVVNLGLPGAGKRAQDDVERLMRMIVDEGLSIQANCAARTVARDIQPIIDISQRVGVPIEVTAFIGSSPIRAEVENWSVDRMKRHTTEAMDLIVENNLPASFVTEDTTRSHPSTLDTLFRAAIDHGATRLVLCDTVGHATPDGLRNLLNFTKGLLRALGVEERVELDWHGHNDRGHALPLALMALEHGVHRAHGTALGVGERVGNASMDLMLLNLHMLGLLDESRHDMSCLVEYVEKASQFTSVAIPPAYPLSGRDAFRTATGVHAAAIIKAEKRGDMMLADRVYSSVPARVYGREQSIEIGHYSGRSNILYWLGKRGIEPRQEVVEAIFAYAKSNDHTLTDTEILNVISHLGA